MKEGTGAWGNVGFIDLGDATLIIDTFLTPRAARELRKAAETLSFSPIKYVINTHWHLDHTIGNQEFKGSTIFSTKETQDHINNNLGNGIKGNVLENWNKAVGNLQIEKENTTDSNIKRGLELEINEIKKFLEEYPSIDVTLPNYILTEKLFELEGSKRKVQFHCLGGGHSISDTVVYLPEDKIVFTGDLVFVDTHPSIHNQPLGKWTAILEELSKLEINTLIAGHGPIGTKEDISAVLEYLKCIRENLISKQEHSESIPEIYQSWRFPHVYSWNLKALKKQIEGEN